MATSYEQILVKKLALLRARIQGGSRGTLQTNYGTYNGEKRVNESRKRINKSAKYK